MKNNCCGVDYKWVKKVNVVLDVSIYVIKND